LLAGDRASPGSGDYQARARVTTRAGIRPQPGSGRGSQGNRASVLDNALDFPERDSGDRRGARGLIGPPDLVRDRLRAYRDCGVTTLRVNPVGGDPRESITGLGTLLDLVNGVNGEAERDAVP